jgi:hypothetical protein
MPPKSEKHGTLKNIFPETSGTTILENCIPGIGFVKGNMKIVLLNYTYLDPVETFICFMNSTV